MGSNKANLSLDLNWIFGIFEIFWSLTLWNIDRRQEKCVCLEDMDHFRQTSANLDNPPRLLEVQGEGTPNKIEGCCAFVFIPVYERHIPPTIHTNRLIGPWVIWMKFR